MRSAKAKKSTRARRAHVSRSKKTRTEREETFYLALLGIRAAAIIASGAINEPYMCMHLQRHVISPLRAMIVALGGEP